MFDNILIIYTARGIWLRDSVGNSGSGVNSNQFYSVRIGQFVNTGIQIDAGGTNTFVGCSFEGIEAGNSPSETPTAILINATSSSGADNNHNSFIGGRFEANTVDVENHNRFTEFYASNVGFGFGKYQGEALPLYVFGGGSPSSVPLIMPGLVYPEGSMSEWASRWNITAPVTFHDDIRVKNDIVTKYVAAEQLEANVEMVDDASNGANGLVAKHTSPGNWGLYVQNIGQFLRKGHYRIVHRYRLVAGSAHLGVYNRTDDVGVTISGATSMKADSLYHTEVAGHFDLDNNHSPDDIIDTYYQLGTSGNLYVEWLRIEESPELF